VAAYPGRAAIVSALAVALLLVLAPATDAFAAPPPAASELPSCAEGPERVGDEILGTPCDDHIVAPPSVAAVYGGPGDDVIVGANSAPIAAATGSPETGLHLEVGSQTFEGGPGNDVVYGDRGNDTLRGNGGNDRLYGGIGDDVLEGGEGDDFLSGGFGADKIDGGEGSDYVRGDATVDHIFDSGASGVDTLSFATGVTPGFTAESNPTGAANFPGPSGERGVWLKLSEGGNNAIDGEPSLGGGNDEVQPGAFERIIGTPFSDYIVGSSAGEEIWGGGGADVIKGGGGPDRIHGGADGDFLEGSAEATIDGEAGNDNCVGTAAKANCEGTAPAVTLRDGTKASVGETTAAPGLTQLYVVGSSAADVLNVSYPGSGDVQLTISGGSFDTAATDAGGCSVSAASASCPVSGLLDAIVLAGMGGNDTIDTEVPDGVGVVELGGAGEDHLIGSNSEDTLVDGEGESADLLEARAGDDALTHNGGPDRLDGGEGSDLFLSVSICDGETIDGGAERVGAPTPDRDNASWARLPGIGVDARLDQGRVGQVGANEEPTCPGGSFDRLERIEDLEGSSQSDVLYGNEGDNQLLGHQGEDTYFALGGDDSILANSGSRDRVIDCGPGLDQATIDFASIGDPTPIECERVREGAAGEFEELPLLSEPPPPLQPPPPPPPPPADRTPPRTKLLRHPAKLLRVAPGHRKPVAFRFAASERSSFRCKLDRKPYFPCRSPRRYRVAVGRHVFRLFAIDAAGNRDRTPAVFQFRVVAIGKHVVGSRHGPAGGGR
jgi:Ca2+-binding RTX toxin-like protein